jgi:hypothetical protein
MTTGVRARVRPMARVSPLVGVLCIAFLLAGCAGTKQVVLEPMTTSLEQYQSLAITVDENVTEDVAEEMRAL